MINYIYLKETQTGLDESICSSDSNRSLNNTGTKDLIINSLNQIDTIEQKMLKALEDDELDDYSTEEIFNKISTSDSKNFGPQTSHCLDQITLHPQVYLHSVLRPQMAEYTSITDSIDTTTIDRPPSPQIFYNDKKHSNDWVGNNQVSSTIYSS